jgi:hypothetical protein
VVIIPLKGNFFRLFIFTVDPLLHNISNDNVTGIPLGGHPTMTVTLLSFTDAMIIVFP